MAYMKVYRDDLGEELTQVQIATGLSQKMARRVFDAEVTRFLAESPRHTVQPSFFNPRPRQLRLFRDGNYVARVYLVTVYG